MMYFSVVINFRHGPFVGCIRRAYHENVYLLQYWPRSDLSSMVSSFVIVHQSYVSTRADEGYILMCLSACAKTTNRPVR